MTPYTLHEHQIQAVKHLADNPRAALFLPMGAGKTLSTLDHLTPDHLPALVVAPKRVAEYVWAQEVAKWRPELSVEVALGTPEKRERAIARRADITVLGRDNMAWLMGLSARVRPKYKTIVLDESQSFKAKGTARWRAARKLTRPAEYVRLLTGTPAGNGLMDLWAQVYLLDGGERLGTSLGAYRQRYFYPALTLDNGVVAKWALKPGAEKAIYRKLADICLHIPITELDLPEQTVNVVPVDMPPLAWRIYDQLKNDMVADLDMLGGPEALTVPSAGVLSSKLSQITCGEVYGEKPDDPRTFLHSGKLDQLEDIVWSTEGGILVFYRFRFQMEAILKRFPEAVPVTRRGAVGDWNDGKIPILVAHPASAGHGLNLQYGGHTIVWAGLTWSSEEWLQGNARLLRHGQKNNVMVHVLSVPNSIDVHQLAAVEGKVTVQQALLDALT